MSTSPPPLPEHPAVWRLGQHRPAPTTGLPTGHAALDQLLAGGGWPRAALIELLQAQPGSGELTLLLPLLQQLSRQSRWLVLVNPPFAPYAPALARAGIDLQRLLLVRPPQPAALLWSCEQSLRAAGCAALLCWPGHRPLRYPELRKLQVAATEGGHPAFLFRDPREAAQSSPSPLRLRLTPTGEGLAIEVLKQRGAHTGQHLLLRHPPVARALPAPADWPLSSPTDTTPLAPSRPIVVTVHQRAAVRPEASPTEQRLP